MSVYLKGSTAVLALVLGIGGSTCHGQSSSSGDVAKQDPGSTAPANVDLPGVDTSALTPREKGEWSTYVSELLAPCSDTPVSIAQCVKEKRACTKCLPAAKYVLKGVRDGETREQIETSYHNRFDASKIKDVPIAGSPTRGSDNAPITIVEFADFECPFCAAFAPTLEKTWDEYKDKVRMVYKFLPLPGHPHGEIAARAGIAAWQQGKFWEMNHTLFANRDHLEQSDLDSYAKQLGLNVDKFHADAQGQLATDRIAQDKKLADALEVKGTPTIYINGREFDPRQDIREWINLELSSVGSSPPTTTGGSAPMAASADAGKAGAAAATSSSGGKH